MPIKSKIKFRPDPNLKLMDQVKQVLRYHHYAYRTEQTYCAWIVHFLKFYDYKKHPKEMGKTEIETFLSFLASNRKVAAATQRQALNAIVFLYKHVLDLPVSDDIDPVRAKKHIRPPVVMSKKEIQRVFEYMHGTSIGVKPYLSFN